MSEQSSPESAGCDWPDELFTFHNDAGEHDPCYVVMPGGAMLSLNHHAGEGVDIARAKFIVAACNAALSLRRHAQRTPDRETIARVIAGKIECELECQSYPKGCGCADDAADAVMSLYSPAFTSTVHQPVEKQTGWCVMRNDIVGQLRGTRYPGQLGMRLQAADEIERLRAAVRALSGSFDPTNHHNANLCPYCSPALTPTDDGGA